MKNLKLKKCKTNSEIQRASLGTWKVTGDSTTYILQKYDISKLFVFLESYNQNKQESINVFHAYFIACALALKEVPEARRIIRFGKIFERESIDLFFHIINPTSGDLLGDVIEESDQLTLKEFREKVQNSIRRVKSGNDIYAKSRRFSFLIPQVLMNSALSFVGFILYSLNLRIPNLPKNPFGTMMISNVGSLGIDCALIPLAKYSRSQFSAAIGKSYRGTKVEQDKIIISDFVDVGYSFDHRLIDGYIFSKFNKQIEFIFDNPHRFFK